MEEIEMETGHRENIYLVHRGPLHWCPSCEMAFISQTFLDKHLLKCPNMRLECIIKMKLKEYFDRCAKNRALLSKNDCKCPHCFKIFKNKSSLWFHRNSYVCRKYDFSADFKPEIGRYQCSLCNKIFTYYSCFLNHIETKDCLKIYKCNICQKRYTKKANLKTHFVSHMHPTNSKTKSYKCKICSSSFAYKSLLLRHSVKHTQEKNFECEFCFKHFKHKHSLERHIITH